MHLVVYRHVRCQLLASVSYGQTSTYYQTTLTVPRCVPLRADRTAWHEAGHTVIAWPAPSATSRVGTSWPRASPRGDIDPVLPMGRAMDKALAYAISALIVGFGVWIFIVDLSSAAPTLCAVTALIPIMIGLLSAFGPK